MKTLTRFWRSLEDLPGFLAIPAVWESQCGEEVAVLRPHLKPTDIRAGHYPCPRLRPGSCPRNIVQLDDGGYLAVCGDREERCEPVALSPEDVYFQALDIRGFSRMIAAVVGVRWQEPVLRGDRTWGIGLSDRRETRSQPVFLILLPDAQRLAAAVMNLLLSVSGAFVIVAPTHRHRSVEMQELLATRGVTFIALEGYVVLDEAGQLAPAPGIADANGWQPTPIADRERAVKRFAARHKCRLLDLWDAAGVHKTCYYDWLKGKLKDHHAQSLRIEKVLREGLPQGFRPRRGSE